MKYFFRDIKNGQIADAYTIIQITNHEAVVDSGDYAALLLAEKHGGEMALKKAEVKAEAKKQEAQ